ncbi:MAG TPA: hypothetical protein DFS52_10015, partial [Myxococcales bacterium]|nr:hypothetical protein [Myxococcales bacterium]
DPDDRRLASALTALDPSADQVSRMAGAVAAQVARRARALSAEWLELLRQRPLVNGPLALAGACVMLATTPFGTLLWGLLSAGLG